MTRAAFATWGLTLDEDDFARALAALGAIQAIYPSYPFQTGDAFSLLTEALQKGRPALPWTLAVEPGRLDDSAGAPSAEALAEAWTAAGAPRAARLEILPGPASDPLLPWIWRQLAHPAVGLSSAYILDEPAQAPVDWTWPLRIGLLDTPASRQLSARLQAGPAGEFMAVPGAGQGAAEGCDLLLLPGSLREAAAAVLQAGSPARAACLVVLGGPGASWPSARLIQDALLTETRAGGLLLANIPMQGQAAWVEAVIEALAEGQSLDRAFFKPGPGLFFAAHRLLSGSRLTEIAGRLAATTEPAVLEREAARLFGFRTGSPGAAALGKRLAKAIETFDFTGEAAATGAAVDFALEVRPPPPARRAPRYLQGQVFELPEGAGARPAGPSLRAEAAHRLSVRIGPPEAGWLNPVDGTAFPEEQLPSETGGHRLQVVFAEPEHVPQPQVGWIYLPAGGGPSTTCSFYFHTRAGAQSFEARITVLHRGRVLQTALLRAPISTGPDREISGEPLALDIEEIVRPEAAGLEGRRAFDAALVVNHSRDGAGRLTAVSPETAALVSLQEVQPVADDIRRKLEEIARDPARFPKKLQAPGTVELLRYLARKGSSLYRLVVLDQLAGSALASARRIQVVSATPEAFLPVEFMYELPPPDREAGLCPNARQALKKGACPGCTAAQASPSPVVCPLGFWGLSRVIERHAYQKSKREELSLSPSEFALLAEPAEGRRELPVLTSAVFAASQRVDAGRRGQIAKVLKALERATAQKAVLVEGWSQWVEAVQARRPSLLVLLPHTLEDEELDEPALEISREQRLLSGDIRAEHVLAAPDPAPPVVLLIGCETLTKGEELQGFIAQFRRSGAAIVLGTVATVLGRHAAPVAAEVASLLGRLTKTEGGISFGDLMLALRREALADGIPMVLGLFAYGDADWQLV